MSKMVEKVGELSDAIRQSMVDQQTVQLPKSLCTDVTTFERLFETKMVVRSFIVKPLKAQERYLDEFDKELNLHISTSKPNCTNDC